MHTHSLSDWTHEHVFDQGNFAAKRGARVVMWITATMMVVEVGLVVNIVCAVILGKAHDHQDGNGKDRHAHHHHDVNLKSAYVHT